MSEDKRIKKTKKNLKQTLMKMLNDMKFEQVTVKKLCETSETSRITFYAHYTDKYDLMDNIFQDMIDISMAHFNRLQLSSNPQHDPVQSYCNLLECILKTYYENFDFFRHTLPAKSAYLNATFYQYLFRYVQQRVELESGSLRPIYSVGKTTSFITFGLWGFISESYMETNPPEQIWLETKEILTKLLNSEILTQNKPFENGK